MKILKRIGLATMALTVLSVNTASATTLEIEGIVKNESVTFEASLKAETSIDVETTSGTKLNTCTASKLNVTTEFPYTAFAGGPISDKISALSFTSCTRKMEVHNPGTLTIEHINGTTNGTVFLSEAYWTVGGPCEPGPETPIGTLTGAEAGGHAILHLNAVLPCGGVLSWLRLKGTYTVTSPTGLGVVE